MPPSVPMPPSVSTSSSSMAPAGSTINCFPYPEAQNICTDIATSRSSALPAAASDPLPSGFCLTGPPQTSAVTMPKAFFVEAVPNSIATDVTDNTHVDPNKLLKCVHRTHLPSTKTRSFCITNENACTFDKDAKRLYNKTYTVL